MPLVDRKLLTASPSPAPWAQLPPSARDAGAVAAPGFAAASDGSLVFMPGPGPFLRAAGTGARLRIMTRSDSNSAKHRLIADLATPQLGKAVALYFDPAQPFAGKTFDFLGCNPPYEITSDDLLAVTLLDVRWSPVAVRSLLIDRSAAVCELLSKIDTDTDLWVSDADLQLKHVDPLWELLCDLPGVRDTRASKLLARKRPRLVPITDSIVVTAVGTPGNTWSTLRDCFQDGQFRQSVMTLRPPHKEDLSLLRIFDVAIWMLYSKSKVARKARQAVGIAPRI